MANEDNQVRVVKDVDFAEMLAHQLHDSNRKQDDKLRLVFLASCQTADRSSGKALRGFAPTLIKSGVPAVMAMQDLMPVRTARKFASTFYDRLLEHGQVDLASNEARATIMAADLPGKANPVLYMSYAQDACSDSAEG